MLGTVSGWDREASSADHLIDVHVVLARMVPRQILVHAVDPQLAEIFWIAVPEADAAAQDAADQAAVARELARALTEEGGGDTLTDDGKLAGIFTDGDLRRTLDRELDVHKTPISEVMTRDCTTVQPGLLAAEALLALATSLLATLTLVAASLILGWALRRR